MVGPGQSIGARWHGMAGGSASCNWQFSAIQQPAGTGAEPLAGGEAQALPERALATLGPPMRTSWHTVPDGSWWAPETVSALNCESGRRQMEVMLLGPGLITMGALTTAPDGAGPVTVEPGATFTWSAAAAGSPALVLPAGWSLGVRWLGMTGERPGAACTWGATVRAGPLAG
ncbi:MAG TPA: hypothetical protein VFO65_11175 [Acidimicrobiales bacterium]|nr:hypothetical protein [Acidimicrobiales bacterium]